MAEFRNYLTSSNMEEGRYYRKDNPELEPFDVSTSRLPGAAAFQGSTKTTHNHAYIKPSPTLVPKSYIVVFSVGTKREKDYFHLITRNPQLYPDIKVDFWGNDCFEPGGNPQITKFAIGKVREYRESSSEDNPDSYWPLTDVDHFGLFLPEMKKECYGNGIELIISNSCFEVWLYYSEKSDKCIDFKVPDDNDKISSSFKTWVNVQIKGGLNPKKAILKIEQNITNAQNNYTEENGIPTLFSTQMFRLAQKMLPYVKDGNSIILSKRN